MTDNTQAAMRLVARIMRPTPIPLPEFTKERERLSPP